MVARLISPSELFHSKRVTLRLATLDDCTERYVAWLQDPVVNQYLETRWSPQTIESVRAFVGAMIVSTDSYLFAIAERETGAHVGNIKIGPIHPRHGYADVSYFLGERSAWGKGLATEAIRIASTVAFERLGLHRVQAGLYASNVGSGRALEKAGFLPEGRFAKQLRCGDGWEDHVWYGLVRERWATLPPVSAGM